MSRSAKACCCAVATVACVAPVRTSMSVLIAIVNASNACWVFMNLISLLAYACAVPTLLLHPNKTQVGPRIILLFLGEGGRWKVSAMHEPFLDFGDLLHGGRNTLQYLSRYCLDYEASGTYYMYSQRGSVSARAFVTSKHCLGIFQPHGNGTYYVVQFQAVETTRSDTCLQPTIGTAKTAAAVSSNEQRPLLQSLTAACRPDF